MLPEAIAIVMAPTDPKRYKYHRVTSQNLYVYYDVYGFRLSYGCHI